LVLESFSVTGIEKEEGMVVGIEELLTMDVLKRFGSVTMWEYEFRLCHLELVVTPCVSYISKVYSGLQQTASAADYNAT
jgi:hypothetical protein